MGKFTLATGLLAVTFSLLPAAISAQQHKFTVPENKTVMVRGHQVPVIKKMKGAHTSASDIIYNGKTSVRKAWGGSAQSDDLITEDFSKFTAGTKDNPDTTSICDEYGTYGPIQWDIDPKYTQTAGWCGSWVFQAGGSAYLKDSYGYVGALINTPLGDYSGDLTITLRVKPVGKYSTLLNVNILKNGYTDPVYAKTDDTTGKSNYSTNLYPGRGWSTISIKFHNISADNDGFIQFLSYGECLIDDINITRTNNFVADPVINPATNFTDKSFTINWQKVSLARDYNVYIYKKNYTSDEAREWTADFENGVPETFLVSGNSTVKKGEGADSSQALALQYGDTLTTPYNFSTYKNATMWLKVVAPDATSDELYNGNITLWVRNISGWKEFGSYYLDSFIKGSTLNLSKDTEGSFDNVYYGLKLTLTGLPASSYLLIDNIDIHAGRDAELAAVGESEENGYMYDNTKKLTYTFDDLDSLSDYYYGVQAHYSMLNSNIALQLAYGVASPKAELATDIDSRGSYTANWKATAKATGYQVNNYGVYTAKADEEHDVLDEDFSKVNADITTATDPTSPEKLGNKTYTNLDNMTKLPGWTSKYTCLAQGYIGAYRDDEVTGSIKTPVLYLANDSLFHLDLNAIGTAGAQLNIITPNQTYNIKFDSNGIISGKYSIPESSPAETLRFYASSGTFMIDHIKISQHIKAGENIYTLLDTAMTDAKTYSHTFTNLYNYDYENYAYHVTSLRTESPLYAESDPSEFILVNLEKKVTTGINLQKSDDTKVIARYNIDGRLLSRPQRGLNIIRMSDGTIKKVIIK